MTEREIIERCASWIEGYTSGQIRMAAGERTAQEMRTVQAVQRWWASALRHLAENPAQFDSSRGNGEER